MDSALTFGRAPRVPRSRTASCLRFLLTQRMSPARPVTSAAARIAPTTDAIKTAVCRMPLPALATLPSGVAKPCRSRDYLKRCHPVWRGRSGLGWLQRCCWLKALRLEIFLQRPAS